MAELVRYVKWAGGMRVGRRPGTQPFQDLVRRARRPQGKGPEMEHGSWRRMLEAALPGMHLDDLRDVWGKRMMHLLRELLQREGTY